ncbi:hypothetical protein [uncultured Porphyromonas sp.]|uniref:hypothetical protein n=1 Tax=uncultured Porphyromonas sp. TaxID=159274 RepID=UPI00262709D6|nr:hypothetical protein [uncultured Porphyromonas sp.]
MPSTLALHLAHPASYTHSPPLLLRPIYRPHLSMTIQTIPALHLAHPASYTRSAPLLLRPIYLPTYLRLYRLPQPCS